ncbi:MAG: DAK2 domain-containing protein [Oscillospiraceae bacterium]|nr:DAK2 domain-containing protein [Oscillospiraceae bacterium]
MRDYIDAAAFKECILCADAALQANIQAINDLNVFPVPDGDTGTNMGLTINNAAVELRKRDFESISAAAECVASAMLRGARGNSGVILSLLFRGIARRLKGIESAGAAEFTGAMNDGVEAAYKAVMKPAEGTILTVSRLASAAAAKACKAGATLEGCLASAIDAGERALDDTMEMNPVLKKAGVIDAGGKGYMVILKAILASLRGEIVSSRLPGAARESKAPEEVFDPDKVIVPEEHIFDTVYVVRKKSPDVDLEPLRRYLDGIGDSLVISDDDEIFKVHVHTDVPGSALTESQKYGDLDIAKIENMRLQALDLLAGRKQKSTDDLDQVEKELEGKGEGGCEPPAAGPAREPAPETPETPEEPAAPEKEYGVVTVCAGAGLEALFRDLGADAIVTGGQTMNPSTDDILRAIDRTPASTVFVFPNNKNIIMAAQQCVPLTEKKVIVMPTKTVPQGISALLNFDPYESEESLVGAMGEAIGKVHTAMITYAARDSDFGGHAIHAGEYLALLDGALIGSYTNIKTLFKELSWAFDDFHPEFITVYYGEDVTEAEANAQVETIKGNFPDADVNVVEGGQPVYYYMIAVE